MAIASKVFITVTMMNVIIFALLSFGGIDGTIGDGYISSEGDIFNSGIIEGINTSSSTVNINTNATGDTGLVADIENNLEPNSAFSYTGIPPGLSMVKKAFKTLFKFIFLPIVIFSTDYGFPPLVSVLLQLIVGVPIVTAYIISLTMLLFGRANWD